jgi:HAD superfamily hydrolase (TIGR01549 family)
VALDFDGVIVDSMPIQEAVWRQVANGILNNRSLEEKLISNLYEGKAHERMFENIDLTESQQQKFREQKNKKWFIYRATVPLMDNAARYIPLLKRRYLTAIVTTAELTYVQSVLQRENLSEYFDLILTDDHVRHGKPFPDMIFELAQRLQLSSPQICVVGDTISDLEMSTSAGAKFIMMTTKTVCVSEYPDYRRVEDWRQLSDLLDLEA